MAAEEKGRISSERYGMFTREVSGIISKIIDEAIAGTAAAARAEGCPVEEIVLPKNEHPAEQKKTEKIDRNYLETVLKTAIPAVLAAIGVGLQVHPALIVLLAGGGGAIGAQLKKSSDGVMQEVPVVELENIKAEVVWDEEKLQATRNAAAQKLEALAQSINAYEKASSEIVDVGVDRGFGEWVQQFLMYCEKNGDDPQLQMLRNVLISRLACMKIKVFDALELNEEGKPDVPLQDYLMDRRQTEAYSEVTVPAVYSDKALLARGEVR